ncbi:unnamed protein product [Linum tenue]|uniref:glutathione gamma-glutamylcysteinyltransferase n=1 Tax=Linum tenue TaxID=586396 RepID=A0AAV0HLS2_9ROSI|nr:unnamed protein product [Linum tenue]
MAMAGLYRRVLPSPPAIDFASSEGKQIFLEAVQNGTMEGFYKLISYFQTQSEPAYCGLASLSMVLNALAIDPGRKWKGNGIWSFTAVQSGCVLNLKYALPQARVLVKSCKQESWTGFAKYLIDEVPVLLKSEDVKDINKVLQVVFMSLPSHFGDFIKWIAEVRRQEDGGENISQEEKGRLAMKEEVLQQVRDTGLFKHVVTLLSSATSSCRNVPTKGNGDDDLSDIAAKLCCQGAEILVGKSFKGGCCMETCVRCLKEHDGKPITVVSGTVVNGGSQQGLEVLVPSSEKEQNSCKCGPSNQIYPASKDVLTALLLALPPETWSGIKDEELLKQVFTLVSIESLPVLLQEEVLHLRHQLRLLKICLRNKEEDLAAPLL